MPGPVLSVSVTSFLSSSQLPRRSLLMRTLKLIELTDITENHIAKQQWSQYWSPWALPWQLAGWLTCDALSEREQRGDDMEIHIMSKSTLHKSHHTHFHIFHSSFHAPWNTSGKSKYCSLEEKMAHNWQEEIGRGRHRMFTEFQFLGNRLAGEFINFSPTSLWRWF